MPKVKTYLSNLMSISVMKKNKRIVSWMPSIKLYSVNWNIMDSHNHIAQQAESQHIVFFNDYKLTGKSIQTYSKLDALYYIIFSKTEYNRFLQSYRELVWSSFLRCKKLQPHFCNYFILT
jgi:hypothetical protein